MNIKMGNPDIVWDDDLRRDIEAVIKSGWVSIGEWVEALESHFRELTGCKYAIATNSATTGLIIAIKAANWKNVRVHLPAFTWPSTLYAILCNNNIPSFHDITKRAWLMDFRFDGIYGDDCIIPVDIFGNQSEVNVDFPKNNRIYDAAHGYGLPNLGKRGIAEVVSLSFTKILTAMEGGIILTDDDGLAETATELRRLSGRMGEINARIAMGSLDRYEETRKYRIDIIGEYKKYLNINYLTQQVPINTTNSVFSILFCETATRNSVMKALAAEGVETKVYYDPLLPGLKNTEYVYNRILSLPTHRGVSSFDVEMICDIINKSAEVTPGKSYLTQGWGDH
jgi:dTDP-4-amino-4,6-dideoxygalactose transaminase